MSINAVEHPTLIFHLQQQEIGKKYKYYMYFDILKFLYLALPKDLETTFFDSL